MTEHRAGGRGRLNSGLGSGEEHVRHRQKHVQSLNDKTYGLQQMNEGLCNSSRLATTPSSLCFQQDGSACIPQHGPLWVG